MDQPNFAPAVSQATPRLRERAPHTLQIARRKPQPGQASTRKLLAEYNEKLICIRYRYDAGNKRQIKAIELVIEEKPWQPRPAKISWNPIMPLRIKYGEVALKPPETSGQAAPAVARASR